MKDAYPSEKFTSAVRSLATNPKTIQERITDAFAFHLHHVMDHPGLPDDVAHKFAAYRAAWDRIDDPHKEGKANVWASRLSDDEAMQIARWICDTAAKLERE